MFAGSACAMHVLMFEDMVLVFGEAVDIVGDHVTADLFQFRPGSGFLGAGSNRISCVLGIPQLANRPINMFKGAHSCAVEGSAGVT